MNTIYDIIIFNKNIFLELDWRNKMKKIMLLLILFISILFINSCFLHGTFEEQIHYRVDGDGGNLINLENGQRIHFVNHKNDLEELFLLIEFELNNKTENKIVYQEHVSANEKFKYIIQSIEDLTETTNWKVSQITEAEATAKGFIKVEE